VIATDNLITGGSMNNNLLRSNTNFEFIRYDITTFTDINGALSGSLHYASSEIPIAYLKLLYK
jgi:hypothetical protein